MESENKDFYTANFNSVSTISATPQSTLSIDMKIKNGWIAGVRCLASPNFDKRPLSCEPSLIVVHCISLPPGEFGGNGINQLFTNKLSANEHPYFKEIQHLKVSSHVLIRRNGEIIQYVSFLDRAWHAGKSIYEGQESCNDFSIGIELEGTEEIAYTQEQYGQLSRVIKILLKSYPALSSGRIAGHSDIAPGRKTDPGPSFDWNQLLPTISQAEVKR
jgi:AmpD protein